jgi:hypothetical protein
VGGRHERRALQRITTPDGSAIIPGGNATPCVACRHCAASKGIHGLVIQRVASHERICLRHLRWLDGSEQHPLHALPELCAANRQHRRLRHRHDDATLDAALDRARNLIRDRLHTRDRSEPQRRWTQRLSLLREDPYADPYPPGENRVGLATYPEAVLLTKLFASQHWRTHPGLHDETERCQKAVAGIVRPTGVAITSSAYIERRAHVVTFGSRVGGCSRRCERCLRQKRTLETAVVAAGCALIRLFCGGAAAVTR